ncbi:T9SS type A sorting domain-containing protein [Neolewinella agarilytica]|uniref:Por secretion system C-terminal sorting domain-containing protein n=1 Tax=Neolewinella agarilytica TaxID=478744 RepID=A0A1H9G3W8_9BACT|nr:T9SS type A sorting domain-containing protein [Neolewinella agarilytica]SEQ44855.1 Por secretion system C-terminal sorting domain-containing protein [Neolewinella agarilytica]
MNSSIFPGILLSSLFVLLFFSGSEAAAQTPCTFNVRTETSQLNTIFNAVVPYENSYKTVGIVRSNEFPHPIGSIIYTADYTGNYFVNKTAYNDEKSLESWARESFISKSEQLYFTGYVNGTGRELLLGKHDLNSDSLLIRTVPHFSYPDQGFFTGIGVKEINEQFFVYGNYKSEHPDFFQDAIVLEVDSMLNLNKSLIIQVSPLSQTSVQDLLARDNGNILVLFCEIESGTFCEPYTKLHIREYDPTLSFYLHEFSFNDTSLISSSNTSLHEAPDGSIYLHAQRLTYLNTNPRCNAAYYEDPRIFKFNDTLGLEWERDFTRPDDFEWESRIADIAPTQDGNFVTVYSQAIPADTPELTFQKVVQLIKFTPDGKLLWRRLYSAFGESDTISVNNKIYDLKPTSDGGFIMVGESQREITNFETDTTEAFRQRGWILKVDAEGRLRPSCLDTTSVSVPWNSAEVVGGIAFPNPTSDLLNVQPRGDWGQHLVFSITDQLGRLIRRHRASIPFTGEVNYSIDVKSLLPGVYHLTVEDGEQRWASTFVKR